MICFLGYKFNNFNLLNQLDFMVERIFYYYLESTPQITHELVKWLSPKSIRMIFEIYKTW